MGCTRSKFGQTQIQNSMPQHAEQCHHCNVFLKRAAGLRTVTSNAMKASLVLFTLEQYDCQQIQI